MASKSNSNKFQCSFCKKYFSKESTYNIHICEKKSRFLQKNEKRVRIGFQSFIKFYQLLYKTEIKSYQDFCDSPYYNAFVKFGSYVNNTKPINPEKYLEFLIQNEIKIDKWTTDKIYYRFLNELIQTEKVEPALERSIETMIEWAEKNNSQWEHYFLYANTNKIIWDIKEGKISPWFVLLSDTGKKFLHNLTEDQVKIIFDVINPEIWMNNFQKCPDSKLLVEQITKTAGV